MIEDQRAAWREIAGKWLVIHDATAAIESCVDAIAEAVALERERCAKVASTALDSCTHPDCLADKSRTGYSSCAGGALARQIVRAIRALGEGK